MKNKELSQGYCLLPDTQLSHPASQQKRFLAHCACTFVQFTQNEPGTVPTCYYVQEQFPIVFSEHKEYVWAFVVLPHIQLRHLNIQQKPLLALVHAHRANSPITILGQSPQGITYKSSLPQPP